MPDTFEWPLWARTHQPPAEARMVPWSFIVDGDVVLDETHDFGVWLGNERWWCAGCLSAERYEFTVDRHPGWPRLNGAPNGLMVVLAHQPAEERMVRRPLCPGRTDV